MTMRISWGSLRTRVVAGAGFVAGTGVAIAGLSGTTGPLSDAWVFYLCLGALGAFFGAYTYALSRIGSDHHEDADGRSAWEGLSEQDRRDLVRVIQALRDD
jgi:hypothetical protein